MAPQDPSYQIKTIETSICKLELREPNVVFLYTFENSTMEISEMKEAHRALSTLVENRPCYLLVFPGPGSTASAEAREYAARIKKGAAIIAEAIIINSLAIRILANFFMRVNRPKQKVKLFSTEVEAWKWIKEMQEKNKI